MTILCHDPPSQSISKSSNVLSSSSSIDLPKIIKKLSVREKSWNYKPSNRYEQQKLTKNNSLCEECRDDYYNHTLKQQKIEIKLDKKNVINMETSDESSESLSSCRKKKDVAILVKLKSLEDSDYNKEEQKLKLPKIEKISLAEEIKRMEDIQVKERVYSVITSERIMTKLRPMRLNDPDWSLAFIQNYLGIADRPMGWFPSRRARH